MYFRGDIPNPRSAQLPGTARSRAIMKRPRLTARSANPENRWIEQVEGFARQEPTKAMASAAGLGLLLNLLPMSGVLGRVLRAALKPALLGLGIYKGVELYRSRRNAA